MESLPLDLLVRVLSLAASGPDSDGTLLLEVAPLVCRRWRDAARDPRCWAYVDVVMRSDYWPDSAQRRTKEYLMLARARDIRNLKFRGQQGQPGYAIRKPYRSFALKPLRASRASLRNVSVNFVWNKMCSDSHDAFLSLLWRSRGSIRSVEVPVDTGAVQAMPPKYKMAHPFSYDLTPAPFSPCERCESPGLRLYLLEVLAEMPRLEELVLDVDLDGYPILYDGELFTMATTRLRRLEVTAYSAFPEALVQMLDDLLHCGAATLEDVEVSGWVPLPESTLRLLAACPKLARLSAHPDCLEDDAMLTLESVKELQIDVCVDPDDPQFNKDDESDEDGDEVNKDKDKNKAKEVDYKAREMVVRAVTSCQRKGLQCLGTLTVRVDFAYDRELAESEVGVCLESLAALSALRPSVKVEFVVNGDTKFSFNKERGGADKVSSVNAQEMHDD